MKRLLLIFSFLILASIGYGQCSLTVTLASSETKVCPGSGVILTATPTGGTEPYTYIWSTGETTPTITVNKGGIYNVSVSDQTPGCSPVVKTETITDGQAPNVPSVNGVFLCQSGSATLTATAPGGVYQWYDASGNFLQSGASFTTPVLSKSTTFYVQTTVSACTSARRAVTVSIGIKPGVINIPVCVGSQGTLEASGADTYIWYDAATGGNVLSSTSTLVTPPLLANTTFYLVATTGGCTTDRIPEIAHVSAPPQVPTSSNLTICSGTTANLHADAPGGVIEWFSSSNGGVPLISSADFTTPVLIKTTTYYVQNAASTCVSSRVPVTVKVVPPPVVPANQTVTICNNSSIALTASATPSGSYQWYDAPTNGKLLSSDNAFITPVLTGSVTYYVQNSNVACSSARAIISVVVQPPVQAPSVSNPIICAGSSATLSATAPGGIYQWYDAATGGNLLYTGASYTTPLLAANTTYYVQTILAGCTSPRAAVNVSVISPDIGPAAANVSVCTGNPAYLSVTNSNGSYQWYDSATGGKLLSSTQVYVTPALTATTVYYVQAISSLGCISKRTAVTATVLPPSSAPSVSAGPAVCSGTSAVLTVTSSGGTNQWYDAATGGALLATGNTFTTPPLAVNTTYYVQNNTNTCPSSRTPVTAKVIPVILTQFQYPSSTVCALSANVKPVLYNPAGGKFSVSHAGLIFVSTTTGEIDLTLSVPGTYTIKYTGNDPCATVTSANFSITGAVYATFSYNTPACLSGVNPTPVFASGASAGIFSSSSANLVFKDNRTGEIDLNNSKPGTYTVTNQIAANGGCPTTTATAVITLDRSPITINAGPGQTIGAGTPVILQGSISGGTGKWSGGSGSFSDLNNPSAVYTPAPGETQVTLKFTSDDPAGPCGVKSSSVIITITPAPPAPVAAGKTICPGSNATLSATAPGGTYTWYDAAANGNLLATGPSFTTPALNATTKYYVQTTVAGSISSRTPVTVTVSAGATTPVVDAVPPICEGSFATLKATGPTGGYQWYDSAVGGNLLSTNNVFVTPALVVNTTYYVQSTVGDCTSGRTVVTVKVTAMPSITSVATATICSGNAQNYSITSNVPSATFSWSRAQVAGISNTALSNQNSSTITETLINTTLSPVVVTYNIMPFNGTCSGNPFKYIVTVYPTPVVTSAATSTFCSGVPGHYAITINDPSAAFAWSRGAVNGISNKPVSGQAIGVIGEALTNTTNAPVNVTYVITYQTISCPGAPFNLTVTVNPTDSVTSASTGFACNGLAQSYQITSNVPGATFNWSRDAVSGISTPAVSNQTSDKITEALINTNNNPVKVIYVITPTANSCTGPSFNYIVTVNPIPIVPVVSSNTPICAGNSIQLSTPNVSNATYTWTGPNGFTSALQNPLIKNATASNSGSYSLFTTVNGCSSQVTTVKVSVDDLPIVDAGADEIECSTVTAITLNGIVSGGTSTGIWSTSGTGKFSPQANQLNGQYLPSVQDKSAGKVTLTLSSTSKDNCTLATSEMVITFAKIQGADAGPNQILCGQSPAAKMNGKILTVGGGLWSSSGTGTFSPSATALNAVYTGSAEDVKNGSVILTLTATSADVCYFPTDTMKVTFTAPPTLNAGGTRYVLIGNTITLTPTVSDANVTYSWSPATGIDDVHAKNPVVTGIQDQTYTLTVTDALGCTAIDKTFIKVSPELKVNNVFTPNGDGRNDFWDITGMVAYVDATIDVFDRNGQKMFHSRGYSTPWDGTYNGNTVPPGTYYYVIDTKVHNQILKGWLTILK